MNGKEKSIEGKTCDQCGRPAAIEMDGKYLCSECYQEYGSCCLEFGEKDLWTETDEDSEK